MKLTYSEWQFYFYESGGGKVYKQSQKLRAPTRNNRTKLPIISPFMDISKLFMDINRPKMDISKPFMDINRPKMDINTPFMDINRAKMDINGAKMDINRPFMDRTLPPYINKINYL